MVGEEKRNQMMQNLFGDQSEEEEDEEEEEEEEIDSEHESNPQPNFISDEGTRAPEPEGDGEVVIEGEGEVEVESEGDVHDVDPDHGESEGERAQSSQEVEVGDQREVSEGKETESEEKEEYGQRVVTSRRRDVVESESERSEESNYVDSDEDEVDQARRSPAEEDQTNLAQSAAEIRDVFGDSDDEEPVEYAVQNDSEQDPNRSPMEEDEGSYGKGLQPEDMLRDEEDQFESEEERVGARIKERPVGPPLELEIPLQSPPAHSDKMNIIKVSNIMGIDPKPFDPKTYKEEDVYVTDESGSRKRIRLENNIVRWRKVKNQDGSQSYESNARFVRWSDGSLQLLIGNEVLDISQQDMQHDQAHLFLRHGKGILQSQGRLLKKMRFMPSSLTSNSHRLLTALVESRHKKVYKMKSCITEIDPEKEKEEKEKALSQEIRATALLSRKREKVSRKYTQSVDRRGGRQLSPGFLEDALEEDEELEYDEPRHSRHRFDEDMELEARAEKRIINAKKGHTDIPRKSSFPAAKSTRRPVDFSDSEREESEYESEEEDYERSAPRKKEQEYEEEDEELEEEEAEAYGASSDEEPKQKGRESGGGHKRKEIESDEESPPRKTATHRRKGLVYDSDED